MPHMAKSDLLALHKVCVLAKVFFRGYDEIADGRTEWSYKPQSMLIRLAHA